MINKITDFYEFVCEPVKHKKKETETVITNIYRSIYYEQEKGRKTVRCEFTIVPFGNKEFMAYVFAIDDNKKKGIKKEFRGNLLWGFGKFLSKKSLYKKIHSYSNMDDVKKDFDL